MDKWPTAKKLYVAQHLSAYHRHQEKLAEQRDDDYQPGDLGDLQEDLDAMDLEDHAGMGRPPAPTPSASATQGEPAVDGKRITKADTSYMDNYDPDEADDEAFRPARLRDRSELTDVHPALRKYENIVRVRGEEDGGDAAADADADATADK